MKTIILMMFLIPYGCQAKANLSRTKLQTLFPLIITNESPKDTSLNIDVRIDYHYGKGQRKTFLPASTLNKRVEIKAGTTVTVHLPHPLQLHQPYNDIKTSLRSQKYEQTGIIVRGVIGNANDPKRYFSIEQDIHDKQELHYFLQTK